MTITNLLCYIIFSSGCNVDTCFTNTRGTYTCAEYDGTATVERNDACVYNYECAGVENVCCLLPCQSYLRVQKT